MAQEKDYWTEHQQPAPDGPVDYHKANHKAKKPYEIQYRYVWIGEGSKPVKSWRWAQGRENWHKVARYETERDMKNALVNYLKKDSLYKGWKVVYRMVYPDGSIVE